MTEATPAAELSLATAIRTTGAVRRFADQAVDDATLYSVLDDARFAPSGGNRQGWRVVVVRDRDTRLALGAMMQQVWDEYKRDGATGQTPFNVVDPAPFAPGSPCDHVDNELLDAIAEIPVMLVIAADLRQVAMMDKDLDRAAIAGGASLYPFCWNLLLAARSRGLGGVLTTFLARAEPAAAALLGMPAHFALAATIFLGHPVHQPTRLRRASVESFTTVETFIGDPFVG